MPLSYENYTGDNVTDTFNIPFTYTATSEISVTVDAVAQTGLTFPSASQVQLTSAPASGTVVQVRRTTDLASRAVDFASGSVLTEEDLDNSNIQIFHSSQEAVDLTNDSVTLASDDKWDMENKVVKNVADPAAAQDAATKNYVDTAATSQVQQAEAAKIAAQTAQTNAETAETNAETAETNAETAQTAAVTAQGLAESAKTGAETARDAAIAAQTAAETAETNAETAETNAETAETNAVTAKNAAETAQTAAEVAQAAAEAAFDNFDDIYLGAKASDPTVDNDGDALTEGDLYFNTVSDNLKVYNGTAWADAALTAANFLTVANNLSDLNNAGTARTNLGLGTAATSASTDFVAVTGDAMTGDLTLGDNNKAIFGAGSDLQIYHDGSNSYIRDVGTGVFLIQGEGDIWLQNSDGTASYARFTNGGAATLYNNNNVKLATTSTGIQVTGTALATTTTDTTNTGSVSLDFTANQNFVLTLTGNVFLTNPPTQAGQSGFITFIQDGTGGRTVSLGTSYKTAGGAGLALSSTANAVDIVPYVIYAAGLILLGTPQLAFS